MGDDMPPVNEFWSMTMYGPDNNFVANEGMRYSVGDRTRGMVKDADGSFTVDIQPDAPSDPAARANWLPAPRQGPFHLILRTYGPKQPVIDQAWAPPAVLAVAG